MKGLIAHGRIGHGGGHHDWLSRDYPEVDCKATGCMFNLNDKCIVPSACKIGDDGKCAGFKPRPTPQKPDGD